MRGNLDFHDFLPCQLGWQGVTPQKTEDCTPNRCKWRNRKFLSQFDLLETKPFLAARRAGSLASFPQIVNLILQDLTIFRGKTCNKNTGVAAPLKFDILYREVVMIKPINIYIIYIYTLYTRRPQPSAGGARPRKSGVKHEATLGSRLAWHWPRTFLVASESDVRQ